MIMQFLQSEGRPKLLLALLTLVLLLDVLIDGNTGLATINMSNLSAAAATMLFAGTYITNKNHAIAIGLYFVILSDIIVMICGRHDPGMSDLFIYAALILVAFLGFYVRRKVQRQTIMVASLVGSMLVFTFLYFGRWLFDNPDADNLLMFYGRNTMNFRGIVMGDLLYNLILFGLYSLFELFIPVKKSA